MTGLQKSVRLYVCPVLYMLILVKIFTLEFLSFSDLALYDLTATHFWSFSSTTKKPNQPTKKKKKPQNFC